MLWISSSIQYYAVLICVTFCFCERERLLDPRCLVQSRLGVRDYGFWMHCLIKLLLFNLSIPSSSFGIFFGILSGLQNFFIHSFVSKISFFNFIVSLRLFFFRAAPIAIYAHCLFFISPSGCSIRSFVSRYRFPRSICTHLWLSC